MPRSPSVLILALAQSLYACPGFSSPLVAITASRHVTRLDGCTRPVAGRSAMLSMTRGASAAKPAPRSGSMAMRPAMRSVASPSSRPSPTFSDSAPASDGSIQTVPIAGAWCSACTGAVSPNLTVIAPRSGYAPSTALTAASLAAPPWAAPARAMLGKLAAWPTSSPRSIAACVNAGGSGLSASTTASPPSSCAASRARPERMRSAKKPTAVNAPTASTTAHSSSFNSPAMKSRQTWRPARRQIEACGRRALPVAKLSFVMPSTVHRSGDRRRARLGRFELWNVAHGHRSGRQRH